MAATNSMTASTGELVFTDPGWMFAETLMLLEQTRDCVIRSVDLYMPPATAALFAVESTRLTARLTSMMSWLMARRAVAAGEIDYATGRDQFRLTDQEICGTDQADQLPPLLSDLRELLNASLLLYRRIEALDRGFDQPAQGFTGYLVCA